MVTGMHLLERDGALRLLDECARSAAAGAGRLVLVGGEAGIGKSALLQAFVQRQPKARILWGACDALTTPRPLGPLHDIALQVKGPLLAAVLAGADRHVLFTGVIDELQRGGHTLVLIEDAHWADEATLDFIKFLGRRIDRLSASVVLTYRDDELGPRHPLRLMTGELPRSAVRRLALEHLSPAAVSRLAAAAGRSVPDLHQITGGNPFFVTEVLAEPGATTPPTIRDAVLARTSRLSARARQLAELASISPGRTEPWLLAAAGVDDPESMEECLNAGMVRPDDGSLAFRHELARRAVVESLEPRRVRELHQRVLAILKQRGGVSPARLVHHALGAGDADEVLRLGPAAAAEAVSLGAHREAASHYESVLRFAERVPAQERARLLERLAYECYLTDRIDRAVAARESALQLWRQLGDRRCEGETLRWLSRLSWFAGRRADADRYALAAIDVLEPLAPGRELAMAYSNRAQLAMLSHDADVAVDWARRAIDLADRLGDQDTLSHALNNLGTAQIVGGDDSGWAPLARSLELALDRGFEEHAARAYTNLASNAIALKRYTDAGAYLDRGIAYCEAHDLDSWRLYMLAYRARARLEQCDWDGASADAEAVLRQPSTAAVTRVPALIVLATLRLRRGDPDAESLLQEARALAEDTAELQRLAPLAATLAEAAWLAGDLENIARTVRPIYERARERGDAWVTGSLAVWLWRGGAAADASAGVAEPHRREMAGDWEGAARLWGSLGCRYEQALSLASSRLERPQGAALAILDELGATAAAQSLRRRMRADGVRRIPRGKRASTRKNPFGLTRREAEVLAHLIDGHRNAAIAKKLFLSEKTVDHHVSAILQKLNVASREEAAALARGGSGGS